MNDTKQMKDVTMMMTTFSVKPEKNCMFWIYVESLPIFYSDFCTANYGSVDPLISSKLAGSLKVKNKDLDKDSQKAPTCSTKPSKGIR